MDHDSNSIFPFLMGRWYTVRNLREAAAAILHKTRSDAQFAAAMRVNDQKVYPWAKAWMEEIFPAFRLAEELGLADDNTFRWTPAGAADVEFRSGEAVIKVQCTTAYAERIGTVAQQGGHLRKLEMKESNATGMVWLGGAITKPKTVDVREDREAWRVGIAAAIRNKLTPDYRGCSLLVYAQRCKIDLIDGDDFHNVIIAAAAHVGRDQWGAIFDRLFVLDSLRGAFVELVRDAAN